MATNERKWECQQIILEILDTHTTTVNDQGNDSLVIEESLKLMSEEEYNDAMRSLHEKDLVDGLGTWNTGDALLRPHITSAGRSLIEREVTVRDAFGPPKETPAAPSVQNFNTTINQHGGSMQLTQGNGNTVNMTVSFDERRLDALAAALDEAEQRDIAAEARDAIGDQSKTENVLRKVADWLASVASGVAASTISSGQIAGVASAMLAA